MTGKPEEAKEEQFTKATPARHLSKYYARCVHICVE
jgi:hypothetical protein